MEINYYLWPEALIRYDLFYNYNYYKYILNYDFLTANTIIHDLMHVV